MTRIERGEIREEEEQQQLLQQNLLGSL
jgi:hypothetical protein